MDEAGLQTGAALGERKRRTLGLLVAWWAALAALAATGLRTPRPALVWNASASSPVGLYLVGPAVRIAPGDMVIARPPREVRGLAAHRLYLPEGVPLVKSVAAVAGERVCASGRAVFVDTKAAGLRRTRDLSGRRLPRWSGCRTLKAGEVFLLSRGTSDAFDGRYFGVTMPGDILGKARLLWRR